MKALIAALSVSLLVWNPATQAQDGPVGDKGSTRTSIFGRKMSTAPPETFSAGTGEKIDKAVIPASNVPTPNMPDQLREATVKIPTEPIEPYLLTKDNGPFMVNARTFRGPDAQGYALALAKELRTVYGLPAYILRTKDFAGKSATRNVPPTAPEYIRQPNLLEPEKVRSYDEAAVLVGDEKTLKDAQILLKKVRKIRPKCLDEIPTIFGWREGLSQATRTTNPFVPAQNLFPGTRKDRLVDQMNSGPQSIYKCPGRYTLQVAEFAGRSGFQFKEDQEPKFFDKISWLKKSPLMTAADDAERVAAALAKDPEVKQTGFTPYVYHDRTSSKVMIGSFDNPVDPSAIQLREKLVKLAVPLSQPKRAGVMIAPATRLTDLKDPAHPIKSDDMVR